MGGVLDETALFAIVLLNVALLQETVTELVPDKSELDEMGSAGDVVLSKELEVRISEELIGELESVWSDKLDTE